MSIETRRVSPAGYVSVAEKVSVPAIVNQAQYCMRLTDHV